MNNIQNIDLPVMDAQVVDIDPDGKYILVLNGVSNEDVESIMRQLSDWWESKEHPMIILSSRTDANIEVRRVDE